MDNKKCRSLALSVSRKQRSVNLVEASCKQLLELNFLLKGTWFTLEGPFFLLIFEIGTNKLITQVVIFSYWHKKSSALVS